MYFRLTSMPELEHLTPSQRRALIRRCVGAWIVWWMIAKSIGLGIFLGIIAGILVQSVLQPGDALVATTFLAGSAFFSFLAYLVSLVRIRGSMLIWLERHGRESELPMCLGCGYDLEGAVSDTCRECGARIVPSREPVP